MQMTEKRIFNSDIIDESFHVRMKVLIFIFIGFWFSKPLFYWFLPPQFLLVILQCLAPFSTSVSFPSCCTIKIDNPRDISLAYSPVPHLPSSWWAGHTHGFKDHCTLTSSKCPFPSNHWPPELQTLLPWRTSPLEYFPKMPHSGYKEKVFNTALKILINWPRHSLGSYLTSLCSPVPDHS